jgi:hypothetical protein
MAAMFGRESTRDIAVGGRAIALAHIEEDRLGRRAIESALAEGRDDRMRMHAENKADIERVHQRIDGIDAKMAALPWKIITWLGALLALLTSVIGYLIQHGGIPLAH